MQPSGEVRRFEVVDLPSPPADRQRSANGVASSYVAKFAQSYASRVQSDADLVLLINPLSGASVLGAELHNARRAAKFGVSKL